MNALTKVPVGMNSSTLPSHFYYEGYDSRVEVQNKPHMTDDVYMVFLLADSDVNTSGVSLTTKCIGVNNYKNSRAFLRETPEYNARNIGMKLYHRETETHGFSNFGHGLPEINNKYFVLHENKILSKLIVDGSMCDIDEISLSINLVFRQLERIRLSGDERKSSKFLMSCIEKKFKTRDFNFINSLLCSWDFSNPRKKEVIALLRTTFRARAYLSGWRNALVEATDSLNSKGFNASSLLSGLYK
jgi:hypothetical protein